MFCLHCTFPDWYQNTTHLGASVIELTISISFDQSIIIISCLMFKTKIMKNMLSNKQEVKRTPFTKYYQFYILSILLFISWNTRNKLNNVLEMKHQNIILYSEENGWSGRWEAQLEAESTVIQWGAPSSSEQDRLWSRWPHPVCSVSFGKTMQPFHLSLTSSLLNSSNRMKAAFCGLKQPSEIQ